MSSLCKSPPVQSKRWNCLKRISNKSLVEFQAFFDRVSAIRPGEFAETLRFLLEFLNVSFSFWMISWNLLPTLDRITWYCHFYLPAPLFLDLFILFSAMIFTRFAETKFFALSFWVFSFSFEFSILELFSEVEKRDLI